MGRNFSALFVAFYCKILYNRIKDIKQVISAGDILSIFSLIFNKTANSLSESAKAFFNSTADVCVLPEIPSVTFVDVFENNFYKFQIPKFFYITSMDNSIASFEGIINFDDNLSNDKVSSLISVVPDMFDSVPAGMKDCIKQKIVNSDCFFEKIRYHVNPRPYDTIKEIVDISGMEYIVYRFHLQDNSIRNLVLSVPIVCNEFEKDYAFAVFDAIVATFIVK